MPPKLLERSDIGFSARVAANQEERRARRTAHATSKHGLSTGVGILKILVLDQLAPMAVSTSPMRCFEESSMSMRLHCLQMAVMADATEDRTPAFRIHAYHHVMTRHQSPATALHSLVGQVHLGSQFCLISNSCQRQSPRR